MSRLPGVASAAVIAAASVLWAPDWIGAPGLAIIAGMLLAPIAPSNWGPGARWLGKHGLWVAVALLGASITLGQLREAGPQVFGVAGTAVAAALLVVPIGILLGVRRPVAWLLGIGTAICGASAIAAARASVGADEEDAAYGVAAVTLLGTVGLVALPIIAGAAAMPSAIASAWAGASLHAVPHAVAAGSIMAGQDGAATAGLYKMSRVALLPVLILILTAARRTRIPSEVVAFIAVVGIASILSGEAISLLQDLDQLAFALAFAGLGLATPWSSFGRVGPRGASFAVLAWVAVLVATLLALRMTVR